MPTLPAALRWLHLSDIHLGAEDGYGHDIVLSALVEAFRDGGTLADRRPDVIFCTGDVAQGGKPGQYAAAEQFFEHLARATGVPMERIFVVPGNHGGPPGAGHACAAEGARAGGWAPPHYASANLPGDAGDLLAAAELAD